MLTLVSYGLSWGHICTFRTLFTPSRVKDASSLNKMTLNSSGSVFTSGTYPYAEHGRLVPDVVPFDHGKDTVTLRAKFIVTYLLFFVLLF